MVGLRGVQGLAPARGRRRNACAGERLSYALLKGSLKMCFSETKMELGKDKRDWRAQRGCTLRFYFSGCVLQEVFGEGGVVGAGEFDVAAVAHNQRGL